MPTVDFYIKELERIGYDNDCSFVMKFNVFTRSEDKNNLRWLVLFYINSNVHFKIKRVSISLYECLKFIYEEVTIKWRLK